MSKLRGLLRRAVTLAESRLPDDVLDAGRRLGNKVPARWTDAIKRVAGDDEPTPAREPRHPEPQREDPEVVLERVRQKADKGLKPEDRVVVIYATPDEAEASREIRRALDGIETTVREINLALDPKTARQIATLTGVMVPPYVFVNGRYWGAQYEILALQVSGDLEAVVANRLDELSAEARRIGKLRESWSDEISVENILDRWKRGHILSVDDLDAWYEVDRDGTEHFYYQGGPRPVETMADVAAEIVAGVEQDGLEAKWLLDPEVHV